MSDYFVASKVVAPENVMILDVVMNVKTVVVFFQTVYNIHQDFLESL